MLPAEAAPTAGPVLSLGDVLRHLQVSRSTTFDHRWAWTSDHRPESIGVLNLDVCAGLQEPVLAGHQVDDLVADEGSSGVLHHHLVTSRMWPM